MFSFTFQCAAYSHLQIHGKLFHQEVFSKNVPYICVKVECLPKYLIQIYRASTYIAKYNIFTQIGI